MSKQSNQRYRKENEKEGLKKEGMETTSGENGGRRNRDKIRTEYQAPPTGSKE
jgi:hypothetical protein